MRRPGSPLSVAVAPFRWRDGDRTIVFGRGRAGDAPDLIGGAPFVLLTTARAAAATPALAQRASAVHHVPAGKVDEVAAGLRDAVEGERLVALGGGRVIDVAKALAAADPPRWVAAVPTTLSGAEMNGHHRLPAGVDAATPRVRVSLVINDPALSASQDVADLAGSAANALGHAVEAAVVAGASPVPELAARAAAGHLVDALTRARQPDRDALALGALLAGYALDGTGLGLHHVLAQTVVRIAGTEHGQTNAALLPHTITALRRRAPATIDDLDAACRGRLTAAAAEFAALAGATRLRDLGVGRAALDDIAAATAKRSELGNTRPRADRRELRGVLDAAY